MAKKRTKDEYAGTKYERQHWRNINTYQKQVENQLDEAVNDAARIGASLADNTNEDEVFSFDDQSPRVQRQADNIINTLQRNIAAIITNGIATEWQLSVDKNNDMSQDWLIENGNTANALNAFLQRQENGLGLSDRIWRYTGQFKDELELALSLGIKHGVSAAELSRTVRRYLNSPDMLFRRVRNKYGQLELSRRAAAYHPGRGVYRSSYRNAIRLTGTETNMAYRTADYNTWMALDFVVGMEVHLSNNHNCKGVPNGEFEDICDQLAGKYPKDFQFTGWHPNCRCYSTAITKTSAEIAEDTRRMMQGLPPLPAESSVNYVRDVPQGFKDWVEANRDRINGTGSLPYFIRNNQAYVNGLLADGSIPNISKAYTAATGSPSNPSQLGSSSQGQTSSSVDAVLSECENLGIQNNPVREWDTIPSEAKLVNRVGFVDPTIPGSCASVALAYAGNKAGFDVQDFRDDVSMNFFGLKSTQRAIAQSVGGSVFITKDGFSGAYTALSQVRTGKQYFLSAGKHTAIVRVGKNSFEYLELQKTMAENGWHPITADELKIRFECGYYKGLNETILIDIEDLAKLSQFRQLLGYINNTF